MKNIHSKNLTDSRLATITGGKGSGFAYWLLGEAGDIWKGFKSGMNHYNKKK